MFSVGDTLGDYQIVSKLSVGGMATLFLGRRADAPHDHPAVAITLAEAMTGAALVAASAATIFLVAGPLLVLAGPGVAIY